MRAGLCPMLVAAAGLSVALGREDTCQQSREESKSLYCLKPGDHPDFS